MGIVYAIVLHLPVTFACDHPIVANPSVKTSKTADESVLQTKRRIETSRERSFVGAGKRGE